MIIVTNRSGSEIDFGAAVPHMDDDIRERLSFELAPCTEQDFFTAYEEAHMAEFGEEWFLSEANPSWQLPISIPPRPTGGGQ